MPKYCYRCDNCNDQFHIWHSISVVLQECVSCDSKQLVRVPSLLGEVRTIRADEVGSVVKRHIEETREEIERQKKDMSKELDK